MFKVIRYIITGSASHTTIEHLFKKLNTTYDSTNSRFSKPYNEFYVNCDLHRSSFNTSGYKFNCDEMRKKGLNYIILIENLNPRPETLAADLEKLTQVFTTAELQKKLIIFFTSSDDKKSLKDIKKSALEMNVLFSSIGIHNQGDRKKFVDNQIITAESLNSELVYVDSYTKMLRFMKYTLLLILSIIGVLCLVFVYVLWIEVDRCEGDSTNLTTFISTATTTTTTTTKVL